MFAILLLTTPVFWTRGTVFISVLYNTILLWVLENPIQIDTAKKWSVWIVQQGRLKLVTALDI